MAGYFPKRQTQNTYKEINVAFILLNKDNLTLKQMADHLSCSIGKVRSTIKEFNIEYKTKHPSFFLKNEKTEQINHF